MTTIHPTGPEGNEPLQTPMQPEWSTTVTLLDHARPEVADEIRRVLMLASAQEAALLGIVNQPLQSGKSEIMTSRLIYLGVGTAEGTLCGWISLDREQPMPGAFAVGSLVVDPARQRRGIGRTLVGAALASVAPAALLVATPALNMPALALYRGLGFTEYRRARSGPANIEIVLLRQAASADVP